ncbi:MAG: histidinol-phosphatase [Chloroflexia bacterium]|nr:histidinol-phosphatase [Chloroflexia bacterium]
MADQDESVASMFDYHVHTTQSADCSTRIEASCEAAILAGVTEIAFTDHIEHEPADMSYGLFDYTTYMRDLESARQEYGDRLVILAGAEVDFNTGIASEVEDFLGRHEFDFVIGSVHYGAGGEIIFPEYFESRSIDDVIKPYLEQIQAAAETGWFDTIGHIDLPKRYRPLGHVAYDPLACERELTHALNAIIDRHMSFEINTSGLRQPPKTSMPGPQIVDLYVKLGGSLVTMGSDSHVPETIGAGFPRTLDMLRLCGIDGISSFRQRVRTTVRVTALVHSS